MRHKEPTLRLETQKAYFGPRFGRIFSLACPPPTPPPRDQAPHQSTPDSTGAKHRTAAMIPPPGSRTVSRCCPRRPSRHGGGVAVNVGRPCPPRAVAASPRGPCSNCSSGTWWTGRPGWPNCPLCWRRCGSVGCGDEALSPSGGRSAKTSAVGGPLCFSAGKICTLSNGSKFTGHVFPPRGKGTIPQCFITGHFTFTLHFTFSALTRGQISKKSCPEKFEGINLPNP